MKATLAALTLATCLAPTAEATVIDFTTLPGNTINPIDQSYGDIAGVLDVIYEYSLNGGPFQQGGVIWPAGYHGADGDSTTALVAPNAGTSIMRVTLVALGGNVLTSVGASLSYWRDFPYPLTISVSVDGTPYASFDNTTVPGLESIELFGQFTTFSFDLGADWNVGYQSINYELSRVLPPVPLPAAGWLMLAGLGALAAARRMRR